MAKIYGVELMNYQETMGIDGAAFSADIFMENINIGLVINSGTGGENIIEFSNRRARKAFTKTAKQYFEDYPHGFAKDNENNWFIEEILMLKETEDVFRQQKKKGMGITISLQFNKRTADVIDYDLSKQEMMVSVANEDQIQEVLDKYKPVEFQVYRSLDDFIIAQ